MKNELISIIFSVFYLYSTTAEDNLKVCPCRYGPMWCQQTKKSSDAVQHNFILGTVYTWIVSSMQGSLDSRIKTPASQWMGE